MFKSRATHKKYFANVFYFVEGIRPMLKSKNTNAHVNMALVFFDERTARLNTRLLRGMYVRLRQPAVLV